MQTLNIIKRKKGEFHPLEFVMDFSYVNKTYLDVENIFFVIKHRVENPDSAALMLKTMADGITIDADNNVVVPWGENEYDGFQTGKEYELGLFAKFTGDPVANENVAEDYRVIIGQDMLHDQ